MTKVILVRHGQTVWNHAMRYQGHTDVELTETGLGQAKLVAERLRPEPIQAVYASDLSRAFQTAEEIARFHALPVQSVPELREIKFGEWEGLTYDEIYARWPEIMDKFYTHTDEIQIPGGESFKELKERAEEAIQKLIRQHEGETIAVVSHGGTIRALLCAALNIHLNFVWNIRQDNTAVNIIEYHNDRAIVALVNDIHHLAPPQP
ncbi:phosphoglycerate/bisphosphoglycerate mutase active site [Lucifera butyrica]|uniref:Alpha-ribazole phosphatase n=1 Tax=Lucifera butyrica TaxID=1351585 RepID=A0A498R2G8_9FIRM|nr:alpha-ribazole phosphatase [Lucifera butyrica]VBB06826.1 phosphoglycerate/bisphosphoglycerate mutase active site [Lucifera butyrica]